MELPYRLVYVITDVYAKADTHRNWSLGPNTDYVYVKADTQVKKPKAKNSQCLL